MVGLLPLSGFLEDLCNVQYSGCLGDYRFLVCHLLHLSSFPSSSLPPFLLSPSLPSSSLPPSLPPSLLPSLPPSSLSVYLLLFLCITGLPLSLPSPSLPLFVFFFFASLPSSLSFPLSLRYLITRVRSRRGDSRLRLGRRRRGMAQCAD